MENQSISITNTTSQTLETQEKTRLTPLKLSKYISSTSLVILFSILAIAGLLIYGLNFWYAYVFFLPLVIAAVKPIVHITNMDLNIQNEFNRSMQNDLWK